MLSQINSPADLAALSHEDLIELSAEIRALLIEKVSKTGGHLGPNLGVVELTVQFTEFLNLLKMSLFLILDINPMFTRC